MKCTVYRAPQISTLLIRDHGLTVWASSTETAWNFVELLEYLFRYRVMARQLNIGHNLGKAD